jgi:hypothetical protein
MKRLGFALATAVALLGATAAQAVPCATAALAACPAPKAVPEPNSFMLTAVGLVALGGLAFVMRKRVRTNEAN